MIAASFIEIQSHPIGMIVSEGAGCRFYGASQIFDAIDGTLFLSAEAARDAAERVLASGRAKAPPAPVRVNS